MELNDHVIGTKIQLPHASGDAKEAFITSCKRYHDGTLIGQANENPMVDSRVYEV